MNKPQWPDRRSVAVPDNTITFESGSGLTLKGRYVLSIFQAA
ncbi:MAG: hypothetical protein AB7F35_13335 [Acetobacteraceae bacterium]